MNRQETDLIRPGAQPAIPERRPYEPPRLTDKQSLEKVTLYSFYCSPGTPGCGLGHP